MGIKTMHAQLFIGVLYVSWIIPDIQLITVESRYNMSDYNIVQH